MTSALPLAPKASAGKTALSMKGIEKRFGRTAALSGVDLEVRRGEVHALVGENGAGKSTLMRVLAGAVRPDAGTMTLDGVAYAPRAPRQALLAGVAMIYQELNLAADLTVAENLVLGREPQRFGVVSRGERAREVDRVLALLDRPELGADRYVRDLGPGARQLVELGRALIGRARVVVMDEPTSSLSAGETRALDAILKRLRDDGVSIVYVSHFLEEVKRLCDRYTVLRDGKTAASGEVATTSAETIVSQMIGRSLDEVFPRVPHEPGEPILELDRIAGRKLPTRASLTLRRGEIFGIAGLVGAGRTELLRAIYGLDAVKSGRVIVRGAERRGAPPDRIAQGLGFASEDRKHEGLALARSIAENMTLSHSAPFARFGVLDLGKRSAIARGFFERLAIKARDPEQSVGELSGGNQQKVAIARLLHQQADVLLLDEPTRGVDVGSKVEIYRRIGELAAQGKAILFVSSYVPELLGVCDRIAVMHRGVLGEAREAAALDAHAILAEATRGAVQA